MNPPATNLRDDPSRVNAAPGEAAVPVCQPARDAGALPAQGRLPAGATDCHCHVFGDPAVYPLNGRRSYTPSLSTFDAYAQMCLSVGITRTVQVNASVYGSDNRITLDAIARWGLDRARGVAGVAPGVTDAALASLHEGGIRGVRLSTHVAGYGGLDLIEALAPRLARRGLHAQLHVLNGAELAAIEPVLAALPVPLVFDHLGCVKGHEGVASPGFRTLLRLLSTRDDCWVKVSSWYRRSDPQVPHWQDMAPLVQALVAARPDRVLFGTNWPHPNLFDATDVPRDADLIDAFVRWVPDDAVRHGILVRNPEALYGFAPT